MDALTELQNWYRGQCNGVGEHSYAVRWQPKHGAALG